MYIVLENLVRLIFFALVVLCINCSEINFINLLHERSASNPYLVLVSNSRIVHAPLRNLYEK
jgi:hypothetical protein